MTIHRVFSSWCASDNRSDLREYLAAHEVSAQGVSRRSFLAGSLRGALLVAGGASVSGVAACALDPANPANRAPGEIRIGSAKFPESEIISRIWAEALTAAGLSVKLVPQIGSREVYLSALEEGSIDIIPEYSGNLAAYYGDVPKGIEPAEVLNVLRENLPEGFEAFAPAQAESKDAYRVLKSTAEQHGVESLADLGKLVAGSVGKRIRIGGSPELAQRPYGPKGLQEFYGIDRSAVEMVGYGDSGGPLTIRALADGAVDVADIFTTTPLRDPSGAPVEMVTLADPKQMIPAQNVVALARRSAVTDEIRAALEQVAARLTTDALIAMNLRSSGDEKAGATLIAKEWFQGQFRSG